MIVRIINEPNLKTNYKTDNSLGKLITDDNILYYFLKIFFIIFSFLVFSLLLSTNYKEQSGNNSILQNGTIV